MFNKNGDEFTHLVTVAKDPSVDPTYSYKFPARQQNGTIKELWAQKIRPIKDLTTLLRGVQLKRNVDYMLEYNHGRYEYWFKEAKHATLFSLIVPQTGQSLASGGQQFDVECPHCANTFPTSQIKWV
jgi:hypothetical protein